MGLIDALLYGLRDVFDASDVQLPRRSRIKFSGGTVTDDPANDRLIVSGGGGGGGTVPSGTGFTKIVSGVQQAAAEPVDLADATERTGILPPANGGTGKTTANLTGQVGKALVVAVGETSYSFVTIPAGVTTPTGNGFRKVVAGVENAAAAAVDLASSTDRTGILPRANQQDQNIGGDGSGTTGALVVAKINGVAVTGTPTIGQVIIAGSGTTAAWGAPPGGAPSGTAGGDLQGTYPNPVVKGLGGVTIGSIGLPGAGATLYSNGTNLDWGPLNLGGGTGYVVGTLPVNRGGTGLTALGTALQVLRTNSGATAMQWATLTIPTSAGSLGQVNISDGSGGWVSATGIGAGSTFISFAFGTGSLPTIGYLRMPGGTQNLMSVRNNGNTADLCALSTTTADRLNIGSNAFSNQFPTVVVSATTTVSIAIGSSAYIYADSSGSAVMIQPGATPALYVIPSSVSTAVPILGYSVPHALSGQATVALLATSSKTLTAAEYSRRILKFTGTNSGTTITITLPHPVSEDSSYEKHIRKTINTAATMTFTTGTGTTYVMPNTTGHAIITVTPDGVSGIHVTSTSVANSATV